MEFFCENYEATSEDELGNAGRMSFLMSVEVLVNHRQYCGVAALTIDTRKEPQNAGSCVL